MNNNSAVLTHTPGIHAAPAALILDEGFYLFLSFHSKAGFGN